MFALVAGQQKPEENPEAPPTAPRNDQEKQIHPNSLEHWKGSGFFPLKLGSIIRSLLIAD